MAEAWSLRLTDPKSRGFSFLPLEGDRSAFQYLKGDGVQPAFSPDGRWLAYASPESGQFEVYVQSVPAGRGKFQISTKGGAQPVWRRDGRELFYQSLDYKIQAVPVTIDKDFKAESPRELFSIDNGQLVQAWQQFAVTADGQPFLVNQNADDHPSLILLQDWLSPRK